MESVTGGLPMRRSLHLALALALFLAPAGLRAQSSMPDEFEVRAAIILNLTKFVVWPAARTADSHSPFTIGLLGYDQQGAVIEKALAGRSVDGRRVAIRRLAPGEPGTDCFLLYVTASERTRYAELQTELTRAGVLTVSDDERFVFSGGIVGLPVTGDRIAIQINLARAQLSGLTISSRLLRLATVVGR